MVTTGITPTLAAARYWNLSTISMLRVLINLTSKSQYLAARRRHASRATMGEGDLPALRVRVVSDSVCPYCYLGKKRMEKAMQRFGAW